MSLNWAERASFRTLLRLCRAADEEPTQIVTLFGRPPRLYHPEQQKPIHAPAGKWPFVDDAVWESCGGSTEYAHPTGSAASAARRMCRRSKLLGSSVLEEMRMLGQRLVAARMESVKLRAVPSSMGPIRSSERHSRPQVHALEPSRLVRLPANSRESLQVGDFLITHPLSGFFQPVLDKAVVLILRVDTDSDTVQGLVLNKCGTDNLSHLLQTVSVNSSSGTILGPDWPRIQWGTFGLEALRPLWACLVYEGGPIVHESLDDSMLWLHTHGLLVPDAREVVSSVYFGGDFGIAAALADSKARHGQAVGLRLFRGFTAWSMTQLSTELERGVWIRARAACPSAAYELCLGSSEPEASWRSALEATGLPALARFPRGHLVDKTLQKMVELHQHNCAKELIDGGRG